MVCRFIPLFLGCQHVSTIHGGAGFLPSTVCIHSYAYEMILLWNGGFPIGGWFTMETPDLKWMILGYPPFLVSSSVSVHQHVWPIPWSQYVPVLHSLQVLSVLGPQFHLEISFEARSCPFTWQWRLENHLWPINPWVQIKMPFVGRWMPSSGQVAMKLGVVQLITTLTQTGLEMLPADCFPLSSDQPPSRTECGDFVIPSTNQQFMAGSLKDVPAQFLALRRMPQTSGCPERSSGRSVMEKPWEKTCRPSPHPRVEIKLRTQVLCFNPGQKWCNRRVTWMSLVTCHWCFAVDPDICWLCLGKALCFTIFSEPEGTSE